MHSRKIWGIAGGSGSGKTTLIRRLRASLGQEKTSVVYIDDYYRDLRHLTLAGAPGLAGLRLRADARPVPRGLRPGLGLHRVPGLRR
ncbi:MAG: hypothetical protein AAF483_21005, partial [Planctomycetota bacterium]